MALVSLRSALRTSVCISIAAGVAFQAAPASAQAAPAAPADETDDTYAGLEAIIVTGTTKRLENTLDVAASITAFSGESLEAKNVVQMSDIATFTPGFTITPAAANSTALSLAIRGQVQVDILATLEPSVGTYVDELYWGRAYGLNANLLDVQSVQVLKGPQGTLFGRNTTGGALVINSADPDPRAFSGKAALTYGRYNEMGGEVVVNVPVTNSVAVRGAFKISHRDGWAYGVRAANASGAFVNTLAGATQIVRDGKKYNDRNEIQGRVKALWEISDTTRLLISGEWYDYSTDGPGRQLIDKIDLNTPTDAVATITPVNLYEPFFAANPNAVGVDAFNCANAISTTTNCTDGILKGRRPYTEVDTRTYLAKFTHDFDFGTFKVIGGYRNVQSDNFVDLDGSAVLMHATSLKQDLSQKSIEAQLAGTILNDALEYVVGGTYFKETGSDLSYSFTGSATGSVPATVTRNYGFIDNDSIGLYGQLKYNFSDTFSVYGGLRYSEDTKRLDIRSANVNLLGVPVPIGGPITNPCNAAGSGVITGATAANDCSAEKTAKFDSISWAAGIDFKPSEDSLLYAKISKGYRSGGHNLRAFNDAQFTPFQPETVIEEEVGFKAELFDRRVRLTVAAYHNELSDAQRSTIAVVPPSTVSNTIVGNAAKVRNYGVEGDLMFEVARGFTISASGSYNKPKYLEYADITGDRSNERFQNLASKKATIGANYRTNFGDTSLNANVDYSWTSAYAGDECSVTGSSACYPATGAPEIGGATALQISQRQFNETKLPAADLLNARLTFGLKDDQFKLSLWGTNLLNDRGYTNYLQLLAPRRNYLSGTRRDPRTYGVTLSVTW